jgi:hypothetical protein
MAIGSLGYVVKAEMVRSALFFAAVIRMESANARRYSSSSGLDRDDQALELLADPVGIS